MRVRLSTSSLLVLRASLGLAFVASGFLKILSLRDARERERYATTRRRSTGRWRSPSKGSASRTACNGTDVDRVGVQ